MMRTIRIIRITARRKPDCRIMKEIQGDCVRFLGNGEENEDALCPV